MSSTPSRVSLLLSMNGSLASEGKSIGGGDLVLFKFIRLSGTQPDVLIPASAQKFAETSGRKILTQKNNGLSMPGIVGAFSGADCAGHLAGVAR